MTALDSDVREHLRGCLNCQQQLLKVVQLVSAPGGECAVIRPQLLDYAEAELGGEGNQPQFGDVRRHLDLCVDCSLDYELLVRSLVPEPSAPTRLTKPIPSPDLSFLQRAQTPQPGTVAQRPTWEQLWQTALHWDGPKRIRIQFSQNLLDALHASRLPPSLSPALSPARAAAGAHSAWRMEVPTATGDLQIVVTAEKQRHHPTDVDLLFEIRDAARGGWPELANIELECRWGEHGLRRAVTDAYGRVIVTGIPQRELATLLIVVDAEVDQADS